MIGIRPAEDRGHANLGWLDSHFTFSFADYYDPDHMGFRSLRVINDDRVSPDMGFGMHPHRDMEILTYVLEGALEHRDSMGNGSVIRPGDVQRMSAGTGITHSEFNPSKTDPAHLLQIWLLPDRKGVTPSYEEKSFSEQERRGRLRLIASGDGREGSTRWHQDADLYASILSTGTTLVHVLRPGRHAWVHVARGSLMLNGLPMKAGDGAAVSEEEALAISGVFEGEALLFDLG